MPKSNLEWLIEKAEEQLVAMLSELKNEGLSEYCDNHEDRPIS